MVSWALMGLRKLHPLFLSANDLCCQPTTYVVSHIIFDNVNCTDFLPSCHLVHEILSLSKMLTDDVCSCWWRQSKLWTTKIISWPGWRCGRESRVVYTGKNNIYDWVANRCNRRSPIRSRVAAESPGSLLTKTFYVRRWRLHSNKMWSTT